MWRCYSKQFTADNVVVNFAVEYRVYQIQKGQIKVHAVDGHWFEYESGAAHLREKGVHNVEVLPNCKVLTPVSVASCSAPRAAGGAMRFCTFSRVMEEKGITDAAESVAALAARGVPCELDIYGAVDVAYRGTLELLLEKHAGTVRYCGTVDSEKKRANTLRL